MVFKDKNRELAITIDSVLKTIDSTCAGDQICDKVDRLYTKAHALYTNNFKIKPLGALQEASIAC